MNLLSFFSRIYAAPAYEYTVRGSRGYIILELFCAEILCLPEIDL